MAYTGNIGRLYTKTYFGSYGTVEQDVHGKYQLKFNRLKEHLDTLKDEVLLNNFSIPDSIGDQVFKLTTIYPGLLIGSGYAHNVLGDDALKLGFFFDHTTGLPCIPGSSVKGVLRDACEKVNGNYILSIIEEIASDDNKDRKVKEEVKTLAKEFLSDEKNKKFLLKEEKKEEKYSDFVNKVFAGKDENGNSLPLKKRDIFFDAFPIDSFNEGSKFLANDYITHHDNQLKNPNPVQFLKVLPQVTFRFDFRLTNKVMNKKLKLELFKQILIDLGIGAKTNVGYGQFLEVDSSFQVTKNENSTKEACKQTIPSGLELKNNEEFEAILLDTQNNYYYFQFIKNEKNCLVRKKIEKAQSELSKAKYDKALIIGGKVIIKIKADFLNSEKPLNFHIINAFGNKSS